jgi:hypothetical protein
VRSFRTASKQASGNESFLIYGMGTVDDHGKDCKEEPLQFLCIVQGHGNEGDFGLVTVTRSDQFSYIVGVDTGSDSYFASSVWFIASLLMPFSKRVFTSRVSATHRAQFDAWVSYVPSSLK